MRKVWILLLAVVMVLALASCGGKTDGDGMENEATEPEAPATVTYEQYMELREMDWPNMSKEEVEEFLGVEGVLNEEVTAMWDEGIEVVDYSGPDEESYLRVTYKQDSEGVFKARSMQGLGTLELQE